MPKLQCITLLIVFNNLKGSRWISKVEENAKQYFGAAKMSAISLNKLTPQSGPINF